MSRALEKARAEAARAAADVEKWVRAVTGAAGELAAAEATEVTDPSQLDSVGDAAVRARGKVGAAQRALDTAETRRSVARRAVLLAEAADEDDEAARVERDVRAHESKVQNLLDQLRDLDGVPYDAVTAESTYSDRRRFGGSGDGQVFQARRLDLLVASARQHRVRAAVLRSTAATGGVPTFNHEVDYTFPDWHAGTPLTGDDVPDSARDYAASLTPEPTAEDVATG